MILGVKNESIAINDTILVNINVKLTTVTEPLTSLQCILGCLGGIVFFFKYMRSHRDKNNNDDD